MLIQRLITMIRIDAKGTVSKQEFEKLNAVNSKYDELEFLVSKKMVESVGEDQYQLTFYGEALISRNKDSVKELSTYYDEH